MGRSYLPESWVRNPTVKPQAKGLACVLASYADTQFGDCDVWPSIKTLTATLNVTARYITELGDAGEAAGWWTRIYERTHTGGVKLTWRLHYPEFQAQESPSEPGTNHSSDRVLLGAIVGESRTEPQTNPNGTRTEPQTNHGSDVMDQGFKGSRGSSVEGSFALASEAPTATKAKPPKPPKPTCITNPPTLADFIARFAEVGTSSDEEAERCWHYYADNGWRMSNGKPLVNWRQSAGTWARAHPAKPSTPKYTYVPPPPLKYDDFGRVIK
jgi:hypothetical protein